MRKTLLTLLLAAAAATVGCRSARTELTSQAPAAAIPPNAFKVQWSRDLGLKDDAPREMYVRGNNLFLLTESNSLYCFNRQSGHLTFVSNVAQTYAGVKPPFVAGDAIILPAGTRLLMLDNRGFLNKTIEVHHPIRSGIVVDEQSIYLGIGSTVDGGGRLVAIDPVKQYSTARWELATGGMASTPAILHGNIYAGSEDGRVFAISSDRTPIWTIPNSTFQTGGRIVADLYADDSGIYVASEDTKLYVLDPVTGKTKWVWYSTMPLFEGPVVTDRHVYIQIPDPGIALIDKNVGGPVRTARWIYEDGRKFLAETDRLAILKDKNNEVVAIDIQTGELRFKSTRKDLTVFATNPLDGTIYAASKNGVVLAGIPVTRPGQVGLLVWSEPSSPVTLAKAE